MKRLGPASEAEMVYLWLRSETGPHKNHLTDPRALALLAPGVDLSNPNDNRARRQLLSYRDAILNTFPSDSRYEHVLVEMGDINDLHIVPVWDWYLDTGGTFLLNDTLTHLRSTRGARHTNGSLQTIAHHADVASRKQYLAAQGATEETLIIIGADGPPYIIVDGTHRASALLQLHHEGQPTFPWKAILVTSPNMRNSRWHIESNHAEEVKDCCRVWVNAGGLW